MCVAQIATLSYALKGEGDLFLKSHSAWVFTLLGALGSSRVTYITGTLCVRASDLTKGEHWAGDCWEEGSFPES